MGCGRGVHDCPSGGGVAHLLAMICGHPLLRLRDETGTCVGWAEGDRSSARGCSFPCKHFPLRAQCFLSMEQCSVVRWRLIPTFPVAL